MINLHRAGKDYAIAFEFHDDIIEIEPSDQAARVRFYQVKTRPATENWTALRLTEISKTGRSKNSIIGKLVQLGITFTQWVDKLAVVSNRPCDFLASSDIGTKFADADAAKIQAFKDAIQQECGLFGSGAIDMLEFYHADIPLENSDYHIEGALNSLVRDTKGEFSFNGAAFARRIAAEVRRRTRHTSELKTHEHIKLCKFISRQNLQSWIDDVYRRSLAAPRWPEYMARLGPLSPRAEKEYHNLWELYKTKRMDLDDRRIEMLIRHIKRYLDESLDLPSFDEILSGTRVELYIRNRGEFQEYPLEFLKVAVLYEYACSDE